MEDALYDIESLRRFAGIELGQDEVPDETTILNFRHLLERNGLTKKMFARINAHLERRGLLVRQGTIVDATIMAAPTSTKNASGKRDPEMSSTKGKRVVLWDETACRGGRRKWGGPHGDGDYREGA
jgi:IS5 family transposase